MTFLRTALNAQRKRGGEVELSTPQFIKKAHEAARQARHRSGHAAPRHQCRLFRQREKAQRDFADGAVRTAVAVLDCRASSFDMYNTCAKVDILAQALLKAEEFFT